MNLIKHLISNQRGNLAIMAAISILPITLAVGAAIDYSRIARAQSAMGSALDSAIISAAKGLSDGTLPDDAVEAHIRAMVLANMQNFGLTSASLNFSNLQNLPDSGKLSIDLSFDLPMSFLSIVNIDSKAVGTSAEVVYGSQNVELAMMLDVTGSMSGSKITNLKIAAKEAVNILLPGANNQDKVRIGLVPYSSSVNAAPYAFTVTDGNSDRCVTGRSGTFKFTDRAPDAIDPIGADPRAVDYNYCPAKKIRPLTSDRNVLTNDIGSYSAGGVTAGHLGVAWSYYMLSPNWNAVWPSNSDPKPYDNTKTLKVALLMTDGIFNTYFEGTTGSPVSSSNVAKAYSAAESICSNMRNDGIVVYSIAFEAPESAQQVLKNCATPDAPGNQHYFNATNGEQLRAAFKQIANNIQNLRISR